MSRKGRRNPRERRPHNDKYATQAAAAQNERRRRDAPWEKVKGQKWGNAVVLPEHLAVEDPASS